MEDISRKTRYRGKHQETRLQERRAVADRHEHRQRRFILVVVVGRATSPTLGVPARLIVE